MNFLSPNLLWGLLAAVPLIAVYFLKVRPRRRQVTAFFLWQQVFDKRQSSSLFQRLRNALSLILMLLTLTAAVFAAAGLRFQKSDERDLVVIIDASPSMRASVNGKTLIVQARSTTRDWIKALNGTRRIAIALASSDLHFISHLSESPRDLLDACNHITATDLPITPASVAAVNAAAAHAAAHTRFVLITDGNRGWEGLAPNIEVLRLSENALPNAGFIAADLEWSGIAGRQARFFYQIASSFPNPKFLELELHNGDDPSFLRVLPLSLNPGEISTATLDVDGAQPGRWTARLVGGDAFSDDDQVACGLAPRIPVRVAIPDTDSYFFQRCVESFQAASGALTLVTSAPDVVLANGSVPPDASTALVFAPHGDSPYWTSIGKPCEVLLPEVKLPGHPVLKNLDFDALRFEGARSIAPPADSLILATAESGAPLIWQTSVANKTAVVVNLEPNEGDFFLSPWFPVIVHNAATHLAGRASPPRAVLATGSVVTLTGGVTSPAGAKLSGPNVWLGQRGHWHTSNGEWFGSAIFSESETVLDAKGLPASALPTERGHPALVWLLILAIGLLAVEMLLYHRRKVG